ncbi:hypothetical protein FACS1894111_01340 [Clostridia bacterium]|nr:hypothetical protein FACS1894111_01340 [Clostridia bacterium]
MEEGVKPLKQDTTKEQEEKLEGSTNDKGMPLLGSAGIYAFILETFHAKEQDIRSYSPLSLAYIGDGVYELVIRSLVLGKGNTSPNKLHRQTSQMVKAKAQSAMMEHLHSHLTEEEAGVYRRGRNANSATMAKNASMSEYRRATGFEALMGYLYLKNELERMLKLIEIGLKGEGFTVSKK